MRMRLPALVTALLAGACSGGSGQTNAPPSEALKSPVASSVDAFIASVPASELASASVELGTNHSISIKEASPGLVIVSEKGPPGTKSFLAEHDGLDALQIYRAASLQAIDANVEAHITSALQRAETLDTLLAAAPLPDRTTDPGNLVPKYYNSNGCFDNTQDLASFHGAYCSNGGSFGSGWTSSWQSSTICQSWSTWFGPQKQGVFTVDESGQFGGSCTQWYAYANYWNGSAWVGNYSYTLAEGSWYYFTWNAKYQQWRLEGDDGQCQQAAVYACFLAK